MKRLKTYLKVLLISFSLSHQRAVEYRIDYILRLLRAVLEVGITIITVSVFYSQITDINGWSKNESLLVFGFFQFISALVFTFVGFGINDLPQNIISGKLDQAIVKPLDTQFFISIRMAFITNIYRSLLGLGIIIYYLAALEIIATPLELMLSVISTIAAAFIYYGLTFMASTTAFWAFTEEIAAIMYSITSIARFPAAFFRRLQKLFYLVPLVFLAGVPASVLAKKEYVPALLSPVVAIIVMCLSRWLWLKGLRSYQSASS